MYADDGLFYGKTAQAEVSEGLGALEKRPPIAGSGIRFNEGKSG